MSSDDQRDFESRYNACFVDFGLKVGAALLIGNMVSVFFLRGRKWPIYITGGLGVGMAYMNCDSSLNGFLRSKDPSVCSVKETP